MRNTFNERRKANRSLKAISIIAGIIYFIALVFLFSNCTTTQYSKEDIELSYQQGFQDADEECLEIQKDLAYHIKDLERENRTNQVLLQTCQDTLTDEFTGDEPWMK